MPRSVISIHFLILASKDVLSILDFVPEYEAKIIGSIILRGKEKELELFTVSKAVITK